MTMKLSEKGINRLYAQVWMNQEDLPQDEIFGFEAIEFQSDDFEDCVMLTVEEAKEAIGDYIDVVAEVVRQRNKPEIKIKHPKSILLLTERIEQAEKAEFPFYENIQEIADYIKREKEQ